MTRKTLEDLLDEAHEAEAKRRGATFYNYGWGADEYSIASKTSLGIFQSDIDPKTKIVTHTWEDKE